MCFHVDGGMFAVKPGMLSTSEGQGKGRLQRTDYFVCVLFCLGN